VDLSEIIEIKVENQLSYGRPLFSLGTGGREVGESTSDVTPGPSIRPAFYSHPARSFVFGSNPACFETARPIKLLFFPFKFGI